MRSKHTGMLIVLLAALAGGAALAQTRGGTTEWLTADGDAQHTSWIRTDMNISLESMSKPGFELQWKSKLDNPPRESSNLHQGITANGVTLFVPVAVVTASSNKVYAIDSDTGYIIWQQHLPGALPTGNAECPGGITGAATRIVSVAPPLAASRGGAPPAAAGRGSYRGALGEPGEGVPVLNTPRAGGPPTPPPAPAATPGTSTPGRAAGTPDPTAGRGGRGAGAPAPSNAGIPGAPLGLAAAGNARVAGVTYVVGSDGVLHVMGLQTGKDMQKPAPFLPPNSKFSDLIAVNTMLYAATSQTCGGAPNGLWAIDLDSAEVKAVTSWKTNGGSIVGSPAFATNGMLIAAIGPGETAANGYANAIVALDPKTLELKDWFTSPDAEFASGPVIFRESEKDVVAAATRDGRILLLDASSLGGPTHTTPLHASPSLVASGGRFTSDGLAVWQEALPAAPGAGPAPVQVGTTWLLAPVDGRPAANLAESVTNGVITNGAIVAMKVTSTEGSPSLQPGWTSRDIPAPTRPIVVNGVVFALASGRQASRAPTGSTAGATAGRAAGGAILYALNGTTGKDLWNSGRTMTSPLSGRSFWSGNSQLQVGTADGTVYAFGFTVERR